MSKNDLEQKAFAKITEYMVEQNRPYSATDVYTNLRQEFGKTLVLKVLESCAASGTLKEKMIGKQKIFYANQVSTLGVFLNSVIPFSLEENLEVCDEAAIADFDSQIGRLSEELKSLTAQNKEIQNGIQLSNNILSII
uniref:TBPIP domain-containing protein n=1 Tax=Angiostrongylus cantonensis TaxID=6313 RepID=A0A0K0D964_ANGCA